MILLDASVLIAFLDATDSHHLAAEELLADAIDDELTVNTLTLAEVLVAPARDGRLDVVRKAFRDLEVRELLFPANAAVRLAQLRAQTRLKMPDCCVLLAAEDAGAQIASFDDRLLRAAQDRNVRTLGRPRE
ncbi:type II toxin-antitoxin system VapC family toxin [Pseudonocardia hispaniensis]|uniref:Ribonuclease VapC n=1 Tax=Pseudonocardia hispaniensis TaxID=904933 RepID=A0ABW1IX81_9PSEU